MKDFFRPDLKLDQKRWHRAIKVIWFIWFFIVIIICWFVFYFRYDPDLYLPTKEYVWEIKDRVTNKVADIKDILKEWEYSSYKNFKNYEKFDYKDWLFDFPNWMCWCSKSWNITKLRKLNADNLYIDFVNSRTDETASYIEDVFKTINEPCIIKIGDDKKRVLYYNPSLLYIYTINTPNKYKITAIWLLQSLWISVLLVSLYTLITI